MPPVASPETTCWTKMSTSVPQVRPPDRVVAAQHVRRPFHHDASGLEEEHVIGQVQRERRVLLDEEDAHAGLVDRLEDAEDLAHDQDRKSTRLNSSHVAI